MMDSSYNKASTLWRNALTNKKLGIRYLVFVTGSMAVLWMLYHAIIPRDGLSFPRDIFKSRTSPAVWEKRADRVKQAFVHAYHGYEQYAAPHDELLPMTDNPVDNFNGWGVSLYDSLDTMLLMDLDEEFKRALPQIERTDFSSSSTKFVPFFETVIRYLGGLLSGYAMSGEPLLLSRAEDLAKVLDPVFHGGTGLPYYGVNVATGETTGPEIVILAEIASCQLEYMYLARLSGKKEHFDRANKIIQVIETADLKKSGGMMPTRWNLSSGQPWDGIFQVSVGAAADSAHEYLLKQYLMEAKKDRAGLEMYLRATTYIITHLLHISRTRHLLYVTDITTLSESPSHIFEHLSCFLPGLFALGAHSLPLDHLEELGINWYDLAANVPGELKQKYRLLAKYNLRDLHFWVAEGLAQSCYLMYADQPTGLGPDEVVMDTQPRPGEGKYADPTRGREGDFGSGLWFDALEKWRKHGGRGAPPGTADRPPVVYDEQEVAAGGRSGHWRDYAVRKPEYLLRPETLESIYLMWRTTGDERWRDFGWSIFEAIERETKTPSGYTVVKHLQRVPPIKGNSMPSYFLAETLKYLYLMFKNEDLVPLDKWVFNTEAHPFEIFNWTSAEKNKFGIL